MITMRSRDCVDRTHTLEHEVDFAEEDDVDNGGTFPPAPDPAPGDPARLSAESRPPQQPSGQPFVPPSDPAWYLSPDQAPYPPSGQPAYPPGVSTSREGPPPGWASLPQTPPRGGPRLAWWHWALIGVGGVVVACSLLAAAVVVVLRAGPSGSMTLGWDYTRTGQDFTIVNRTDRFAAGDQLAYVVRLNRPIGATSGRLVVMHVLSGGDTPVFMAGFSISDSLASEFANHYTEADDLLDLDPPGRYRLEFTTGTRILAQATLTYLG
jgi:hypothetical protein